MTRYSDQQLSQAFLFAWGLADAAEDILRENRHGAVVEMKPDDTPVTAVDRAIEEMVEHEVRTDRPWEVVLGEENVRSHLPNGSAVWVVDPIDGTELFAKGQQGYVFSLALVIDGSPQIAVVRDPVNMTTWFAQLGHGAFVSDVGTRPDRGLNVSSTTDFTRSKLRVPRGPANDRYLWPEVVSTVRASGIQTLEIGSVVRCAMAVAEGELDGLIFGRSGPWDMAAAALIVSEAGGRATSLLGMNQRYDRPVNGAILSNGLIHEDLLQVVADQAR